MRWFILNCYTSFCVAVWLYVKNVFQLGNIPKPVWAVGFALEQTLRDATLHVFSFLI
ncbi:MAG: hypothetical protein LBH59_10640 [Planctomycetaceae bacterium]|nr:hypothetical protein [Planctomycetaceae bacterium]